MHTAAFDAQQALYELLRAEPTLAAQRIPVTLGSPTTLEREHIWVPASIEDWTMRPATSGLRNRDENFILPIHIFVDMTTNTYPDVRNRIKAIGLLIEEALAADPQLGGVLMLATVSAARLEDTYNDADRRRALLLTIQVRCNAWLG